MAKRNPRAAKRARCRRKPSFVRPAKSPESARTSARSTMSGPSSKAGALSIRATPPPARWRRPASSPPQCQRTRTSRGVRRAPRATQRRVRIVEPRDPAITGSTLTESNPSPEARHGRSAGGLQCHQRPARPRARRLRRARAHDQPGRAGRRQPELAQGGPARARAARRLHPAREDHALRPRAHSRAHRARARLGGARLLRVLRAADADSRARRCSPRPASARRCSCASRPWPASAARPTRRATCAASR